MKNKIAILFTSLSLVILLSTYCLSYNVEVEGKSGHQSLADKAIQLKKNVNPSLGNELSRSIQDTIKKATSAEDINGDGQFMPYLRHFYDPTTGKGFLESDNATIENAKHRANRYYQNAVKAYCTGDKQKGWDIFGHAMHLLQDMGSPSHVHNGSHAFQSFSLFSTWGFENYVSNNWATLGPQVVAADCELGDINLYMQTMASYTHNNYGKYDREYVTTDLGPPPAINYVPVPVTKGEDPYPNEPYNTIALLNKTVCYSAGLIDTFWNDVQLCAQKPPKPTPGGGHPDDNLDVSTDFYLETTLNLSFNECLGTLCPKCLFV